MKSPSPAPPPPMPISEERQVGRAWISALLGQGAYWKVLESLINTPSEESLESLPGLNPFPTVILIIRINLQTTASK